MSAIIDTNNTELTQRVIDTIKTCYDPEIPVDIWELGLIYEIKIDDECEEVCGPLRGVPLDL